MKSEDTPYARALRKAFRSLAARDRTEWEIRTRLKAGSFDDATVDSVIKRLYELGYLDDASTARRWIRHLALEKLLSDRRIEARLAERGLDRSLIRQAIAEIRREMSEAEAVRKILRRQNNPEMQPGTPERRKWSRRLMGLGFSPEAVFDTLREIGNEEEEAS
jgi:regulatory protein